MRRYLPIWAIPLFVVFSVGTVWLRLAAVGASYSISRTEKMITELRNVQEKTDIRLASLKSPRRLEKIARDRMGLRPATAEQVIRIR